MRRTFIAVATVLLAVPALGLAHPGHHKTRAKLDDPTIIAIFDAANTADIETGRIAVKRGQTKEVRDFGAMLERDHTMVRKMGRDLAQQLKVTPTPPTDGDFAANHAAAVKKLQSVPDKDFDQTFLRHEVDFHAAVIQLINTSLMPAIQNAELKDLVTKVAPAFEAHRAAAANLSKKLAQ